MDLRFTDEENAFREEVRQFFEENLPKDIHEKMLDGDYPDKDDLTRWTRILNDKGWAVPHWPVEWGGTGWDPMKQYIFLEELQKFPCPAPLAFGVNMVGPVIYTFASQEQKQRYLPRIANLDDWWCQGFS
ncbi:MAG: acyl-CoA dehydrogenase family protein, partial [Notoacmeibacter sp.]|nr:acyl-CoA dehydrogenase family protein [Notoacmeibacter sp.]